MAWGKSSRHSSKGPPRQHIPFWEAPKRASAAATIFNPDGAHLAYMKTSEGLVACPDSDRAHGIGTIAGLVIQNRLRPLSINDSGLNQENEKCPEGFHG
ncbi:MAG: hypothetical protein ACRD4Q_03750 [Candidatus Acidiferrales bacterium]